MSQIASPSSSGAGAEGSSARPAGPRLARATLVIGLLITVTVLTANVWLSARLTQDLRRESREHAFWVVCQPGHSAAERAGAFLQLAGANLAGARALKGSFSQADLSGADLTEADFSETQLYRANLGQTRLRRAKLRAAYLQEVQAEKADLVMADLSDAVCLMANFTGARLNGANLSGANLEAAILRGANLSLARMDGANLKDADFTNANWWRSLGLSLEQINLLSKKFAPATNAEPALKLDYDKWANS